jgi:uncharacterized protein
MSIPTRLFSLDGDFNLSTSRPTVAVIGASNDRSKYGNKAVRAFQRQGWDIYPVNPSVDEVEGIAAFPDLAAVPLERLDRVTLYVPPRVGLGIIEDVARKTVGEVWLNPGSESPELVARAESLGLNVIQACSILDIGENPGRL